MVFGRLSYHLHCVKLRDFDQPKVVIIPWFWEKTEKCMIKIFRGSGVVTPSNPLPYEQLVPSPPPVLRCFGKIP